MLNFKNQCKKFFSDEEGSELMQWAIIIIIVVGLAVIAFRIAQKLTGNLEQAERDLDDIGGGLSGGGGGGAVAPGGGGGAGGGATPPTP